MSLAFLGTMRRRSRIILMASMWISMTLLMRASSGARGKAATKMVVKLYWITVEGEMPGAGVKPLQRGCPCPSLPGFVLLCGLGQRGLQGWKWGIATSWGCPALTGLSETGICGELSQPGSGTPWGYKPWPWKERKV